MTRQRAAQTPATAAGMTATAVLPLVETTDAVETSDPAAAIAPNGPRRKQAPERRCIVSGETGGKAGLIRFVLSPDGVVFPDLAERLPGRGVWVLADRAMVEQGTRKNAFARAFKQAVKVPPDLVTMIESALVRRTIEAIGMARKAGLAVCGFEKTKFCLLSGKAVALIEARDGAEDGMRKLRSMGEGTQRINRLDSHELGLAFGRDSVIHAALERGGASLRAAREARRLAGFRAPPGGSEQGSDQRGVEQAQDQLGHAMRRALGA